LHPWAISAKEHPTLVLPGLYSWPPPTSPPPAGGRYSLGTSFLEITLAAGAHIEDIVQGYRGRVSRAAIMEAVQLVTEQLLKTLPDLKPVG